jgi:hypothetical protein
MNKLTIKYINLFIYFIIFIKIIFLLCVIGEITFKYYHKNSTQSKYWEGIFEYWHQRTEFIFSICIAVLLIFIFSPKNNHVIYITKEMTILFYLFGLFLILTAKWSLFISESNIYKKISNKLK